MTCSSTHGHGFLDQSGYIREREREREANGCFMRGALTNRWTNCSLDFDDDDDDDNDDNDDDDDDDDDDDKPSLI